MTGRAARLVPALVLIVAACAGPTAEATVTPSDPAPPSLPDRGEAPELVSDVWLNSEGPLRLKDLLGKVVLIDFWTFG